MKREMSPTDKDAPGTLVGHEAEGAAHTLLEQRPYRQSFPVMQAAPTAPQVLETRDKAVAL